MIFPPHNKAAHMRGKGCVVVPKLTVVLGALLIGWSAFSPPAGAQMMCVPRDALLAALKKTHSEIPVSGGLTANGAVLEVLSSAEGSWTVIMTRPDGVSCIVAAGENWEDLATRKTGAKA